MNYIHVQFFLYQQLFRLHIDSTYMYNHTYLYITIFTASGYKIMSCLSQIQNIFRERSHPVHTSACSADVAWFSAGSQHVSAVALTLASTCPHGAQLVAVVARVTWGETASQISTVLKIARSYQKKERINVKITKRLTVNKWLIKQAMKKKITMHGSTHFQAPPNAIDFL